MPLPSFLDDALLQAIARENNLSETALVPYGEDWRLRWLDSADSVRRVTPDFRAIARLDAGGLIVTVRETLRETLWRREGTTA